MLDLRELYKIQSDYGVTDGTFRDMEITFAEYIAKCRAYTSRNLPPEYNTGNWDDETKTRTLYNITTEFVDKHRVRVKGYTREDGTVDIELLLEDVLNTIMGSHIIKEAEENEEIDEIQINDLKTIFVVRKGVTEPYVDSKGRVPQFTDNDEILTLLNRLINDGTGNMPQFTDGHPILNAKTAKHQYRVNAVHPVANTMDKPPHNFPITTVVIRKFKETKLTLEDLIKGKSITPKMGRLLDKLGKAELKLFCVGPTGSGKTTLLNIIANTIPIKKRIILIQNPTEISFFERDEYGRNIRNVVHWEVKPDGKDGKSSASMAGLISNALRATPDVIIIGEAREDEEFYQIYRAMRTGHKTLGTFHAEDAYDAIGRFATEISTASNMTNTEATRLVADTIDIIISQFKFEDGSRKVMEISEVRGTDENGKPVVNVLFEYELTGEVERHPNGDPLVVGRFVHKNPISEDLKRAFFKAGIGLEEIREFIEINDNMD